MLLVQACQRYPVPLALLRLLRDMGIALRPDGNHLYVDITAGNVTRAILEALRQHQDALLDLVEALEERAAIAQYCAGLPRVEAEALAWQAVMVFNNPSGNHRVQAMEG